MLSDETAVAPTQILGLWEVSKVAHQLNYSERQVRRWLRDGRLRAFYINGRWRVDPADVDAFKEKHRWDPPTTTDDQEARGATPDADSPVPLPHRNPR